MVPPPGLEPGTCGLSARKTPFAIRRKPARGRSVSIGSGWDDARRRVESAAPDRRAELVRAVLSRTPANDYELGQWSFCRDYHRRGNVGAHEG